MIQMTWRDRAVSFAFAYADFTWSAEEKNIFHGYDPDGVLVNTPDAGYESAIVGRGWWRAGEVGRGVPYDWGGASSLSDFEMGIREGKYAGNVPDSRENGISRHCVGVDCSGLVTVCWGMEKKLSTRTIPLAADPLPSLDLLLPGDAILTTGHVLVFADFLDGLKTEATIIEASRSAGRVRVRTVQIPDLAASYVAYRKKE